MDKARLQKRMARIEREEENADDELVKVRMAQLERAQQRMAQFEQEEREEQKQKEEERMAQLERAQQRMAQFEREEEENQEEERERPASTPAIITREALTAAYDTALKAHKAALENPAYLDYYNKVSAEYQAILQLYNAQSAAGGRSRRRRVKNHKTKKNRNHKSRKNRR